MNIDWDEELRKRLDPKGYTKPEAKGLDHGIDWDSELSARIGAPKTKGVAPMPEQKEESWIGKIRNAITGKGKSEFDYPELPAMVMDNGKVIPIQETLSFDAGNPIRQAETLVNSLGLSPDDIDYDNQGNQYLSLGGKKFYVNRPGASWADAYRVLEGFGLYGATGGVASGATKGIAKSLISKAMVSGSTAGVTSLAEDLISNPDITPDLFKASFIAALGFGGEFAVPVVDKLITKVVGTKALYKDGVPTEKGRKVLEDAGIDPDVITDDVSKFFSGKAQKSVGVEITHPSLPYAVPTTKGKYTGDIAQQAKEDAMLSVGRGEKAADIMHKAIKDEETALRRNALKLKQNMGAGGVSAPGEGAKQIVDDYLAKKAVLKKPVNELYKKAKKSESWFPKDHVKEFRDDLAEYIDMEGHTLEGMIGNRFNSLDKIIDKGKDVNLRDLERWRKSVTNAAHLLKHSSPEISLGLRRMRSRYDEMITSNITTHLAQGTPEAVNLWRDAVASRKRMGELLGHSFDKLLRNDDITEAHALNYILGSSKVGTQMKSAAMVREIKRVFGNGSDQHKMLKDELFLKLLAGQPESGFSAQKYITQLGRYNREYREVFKEIFTEKERDALSALGRVARQTIPDPRATNPSKSGAAIARMIQENFGITGRIADTILRRFAEKFVQASNTREARDALIMPSVKRKFLPEGMVMPALSAEIYKQQDQ